MKIEWTAVDTEPEIVMRESDYNKMVDDIATMDGEIEYLNIVIAYLRSQIDEWDLDVCDCANCIREFMTKGEGIH